MLLVIAFQIDSIPTYRIEESRISAQIYNFRNEFDMNSIIYTRLREPISPFEDIGAYLVGVSGVVPSMDGLSVRGGGYMENAIFINGIPLSGLPYRFLNFLPVDRDAIRVIRLYRGDLPARYDGILSAVVDVETDERDSYVKVGIPNAALRVDGFYLDYFLPGLFTLNGFYWRSATSLFKRGNFSFLAMGMNIRQTDIINYFYDESGNDTIYYWDDRAMTTGFSFRKRDLWAYSSLEIRIHRDSSTSEGLVSGRTYKWISGLWFQKGSFGVHLQNHVYVSPQLSDSLNSMVFERHTHMLSLYYDFGKITAGVDVLPPFRLYPLIRYAHKVFLDSTRAIRIFAGTTVQPFFAWGFPFYERVIPSDRVNMGYTLIAGYEKISSPYTLEVNLFLRYFHPYYVPNPLLFGYDFPDSVIISPSMVFVDRSSISAGLDLYLNGFRGRDMSLSLTLMRSLFVDTWTPAPEDIVLSFDFQYRFIDVRWIYGFVRWELVFNPENLEHNTYRESPMYIYSIMFPFRWKGFHFRIGVYNFIPQPQPSGEFSSIYRAFPIPILSVKREF